MSEVPNNELEALEIELLLEGVYRRYGLDFRNYAPGSITRRVWKAVHAERLTTISSLQDRVLHDQMAMERLLRALTVHVTSMFRDPGFFRTFREKVVPVLRTYPFVRIWHAGCSTGEEVYSMAILLKEERLKSRCTIYATDMSEAVLKTARDGIVPLSFMREDTENYLKAGGTSAFSEYYVARYDHAIFDPSLRENIVFAQHNLATDGSFNEFNVIICRNVMIYFNATLQGRVHDLLYRSLCTFGILGLGRKESLRFTPFGDRYEAIDESERIFRRVG